MNIFFLIFWLIPVVLTHFWLIWYFTCIKHESIPLILVLLFVLFSWIPLIGYAIFMYLIMESFFKIEDRVCQLKDNWFNRVFLAYHAE